MEGTIRDAIASDLTEGEFTPEKVISLEASHSQAEKRKPSFVLTGQNEKTSARFENYTALLA